MGGVSGTWAEADVSVGAYFLVFATTLRSQLMNTARISLAKKRKKKFHRTDLKGINERMNRGVVALK